VGDRPPVHHVEPGADRQVAEDRSTTDPGAPSVYEQSRTKASFTREQYASLIAALVSTDDDEFRIATPNAYFIALLSIGARPGEMDAVRWE
jgi:hypothetical protein